MESDMTPRKDRRFKQWNKTKITLLSDPRNAENLPGVEAFTYDLSIGGARLHTAESFEVGTPIRLQIELVRTGETLRVEGVVKWRRWEDSAGVYEMGVEFEHGIPTGVLVLINHLYGKGQGAPTPTHA
jgi:Tfp pilus assembly protein PilZ